MASWTRRAVVLGVLAGLSAVVASACADNNQTLFIRQVQAPEDAQCSYSSDPTSEFFMMGVLDLMLTSQYRATVLVGNQMVQRGNADMVRTETNRVQLTDAEVRLEYTNGDPVTPGRDTFSIPGNGFVDPGTGTSPGWGVFRTVLVDTAAGDTLRSKVTSNTLDQRSSTMGRVVAVVKVFGKSLGGDELETGEFRYPIEVCYGCLVSFPAGRTLSDGVLAEPNCKGCADATDVDTPCTVGQDYAIDCCLCHSLLGAENALCEPQP